MNIKRTVAMTLLPFSIMAMAACGDDSSMDSESMSTSMEKDDSMMTDDAMESEDSMDKDAMEGMDDESMSKDDSMTPDESDESMSKDDAMEQDDAMESEDAMDKDDSMMKGESMMAGEYITYEEYSASMANHDGPVVLFFNASWCPDCQAMDKALMDPANVPGGVTIVSVDYDKHHDLREKYGVTMQHTFVQVDEDGMKVNSWNATSIEDIPSGIK